MALLRSCDLCGRTTTSSLIKQEGRLRTYPYFKIELDPASTGPSDDPLDKLVGGTGNLFCSLECLGEAVTGVVNEARSSKSVEHQDRFPWVLRSYVDRVASPDRLGPDYSAQAKDSNE